MVTLAEHLKDPDVILSTNLEVALYRMAEKLGISHEEIQAGKYDQIFGDTKEDCYKLFSKRLGFRYHWAGHYHIDDGH